MYQGKFSDRTSGRHGPSGGPRGGKKFTREERAALVEQLRSQDKEVAEKALDALRRLNKIAEKMKSGFGAAMRFVTRRRG